MKTNATRDERPVAVEICAGAGGMTEGLERAGFRVVALEVDPVAVEMSRSVGHDAREFDVSAGIPEDVLAI